MARRRRYLLPLCLCVLVALGVWAGGRGRPRGPGRRPPAGPAAPLPLQTGLGPLLPPLRQGSLRQGFGWSERAGRPVFQPYLVFAAPPGARLRAVAAGVVVGAHDRADTYGLYVEVRHTRGWSSLYGGCVQVLVAAGRALAAGAPVCAAGPPGGAVFGLSFRGHPVNPLPYLEPAR